MDGLPKQLRKWIWWRDRHRCLGCGVEVAQENGCEPQTHHIKPKSRGGTDKPDNLATLCLLHHATLDSPSHRGILDKIRPDERPSVIKALLWQNAAQTLVFTENLSCRKFPAQQVLDYLNEQIHVMEYIRDETLDTIQENPNLLLNKAQFRYEDPDLLPNLLEGVRTFYWSRQAREVFNEEVCDDSPGSPKSSRAVFLWVFAKLGEMTEWSQRGGRGLP